MNVCVWYIVVVLGSVMVLSIPTLCSIIMSEQHVELSLVKIELLSKMLLHYITVDSNMH
jgi:hypothetical protein